MQLLKIINTKGESILFGMHSPYLLSHIEGLGIPQADMYTTQAPSQDGSNVHDVLLADRIISAKLTILCEDRENLYKERRRLMQILNPKLGPLKLLYTNDDKTYRAYGYVESEADFKERIKNHGVVNVSFICSDPYWLDESDVVTELKYIKNNGFSFPAIFATKFAQMSYKKKIVNKGDIEVGCKIEYIGEAINPIVTNETTGEFIKVNRTLEAGQKLIINTSEGEETVDIISADGNKTNVFNWIDLESTFFKLKVGENIISYSSDNETAQDVAINVIYSNKYAGV